jgi:hypothetical protein
VTLPGTTVTTADAPRRRVTPTNTATRFTVGLTERGPVVPTAVYSLADAAAKFGNRVTYGLIYDELSGFFGERGSVAYVSRVVGPAATVATHTFNDALSAPSIRVDAANPGDWGARLKTAVVAGSQAGYYVLVITLDDIEVDRSLDLLDVQAAVDWGAQSDWVRVTALGAADPAVIAATALTGGTDDRASITDAHWQTALDRFGKELGPGQVSMPGRYSVIAQTAVLTHCRDRNRRARLDADPLATRAALVTNAATLRALGVDLARRGTLYARWGVADGLTPGSTRLIPYSSIQAGMDARNDAANPVGTPVAGDNGQSLFLRDLAPNGATWTEADLEALADAGVTVARNFNGVIQTYDNVTLVNQTIDEKWLDESTGRLAMAITALGGQIGDRHMWKLIDGQGFEVSDFKTDLEAMLTRMWLDGELYGRTAADAFTVNIDDPVNTTESIAARKLRAKIGFKPSRGARRVEIEIGNTPLTEAF